MPRVNEYVTVPEVIIYDVSCYNLPGGSRHRSNLWVEIFLTFCMRIKIGSSIPQIVTHMSNSNKPNDYEIFFNKICCN